MTTDLSAQDAGQAVDVQDIADSLSVEALRAYGKTSPASVRTRIGQLDFTEGGFAGGYPSLETVRKLYDEMDFQRATQAYIAYPYDKRSSSPSLDVVVVDDDVPWGQG
jgi:hypothetical protein